MKQTYIEYVSPGIMFSESFTRKVEGRSIPSDIPDNVHGFRFFDMTEVETTDGEKLFGKPLNYSKWFYVDAKSYSIDEVKSKFPDKTTLISNMESNNYYKIIHTKFGQWLPMNEGDIVI